MKDKETFCGQPLQFRVAFADITKLDEVCERLDLARSEIARRALREGLKLFDNAQLPGVGE